MEATYPRRLTSPPLSLPCVLRSPHKLIRVSLPGLSESSSSIILNFSSTFNISPVLNPSPLHVLGYSLSHRCTTYWTINKTSKIKNYLTKLCLFFFPLRMITYILTNSSIYQSQGKQSTVHGPNWPWLFLYINFYWNLCLFMCADYCCFLASVWELTSCKRDHIVCRAKIADHVALWRKVCWPPC